MLENSLNSQCQCVNVKDSYLKVEMIFEKVKCVCRRKGWMEDLLLQPLKGKVKRIRRKNAN